LSRGRERIERGAPGRHRGQRLAGRPKLDDPCGNENGAQVPSADYAGYRDFQDYGVMFPSCIVQKVDGPRRRRPDGHRGVGQSLSDLSAAEGTGHLRTRTARYRGAFLSIRSGHSKRRQLLSAPWSGNRPHRIVRFWLRRRDRHIIRHLSLRNPSSAAYYFVINIAPLSCIVTKRSCRHRNSKG